jgi:tetratricopeptide (TPR) repeat protein
MIIINTKTISSSKVIAALILYTLLTIIFYQIISSSESGDDNNISSPINSGKYNEALSVAKKALDNNPNDEAFYDKSRALIYLGKYDED